MAHLIKITSWSNPQIKFLKQLRRGPDRQQKIFFLEGAHLCQEAWLQQRLRQLFITEKNWQLCSWAPKFSGTVFLISEAVAESLATTVSATGFYGVGEILEKPLLMTVNTLVLAGLQDPGNLGTLLRSAAAFNFQNVVISPDSVSFYNPKVVRATQGLIFHLNLLQTPLEPFLEALDPRHTQVWGTQLQDVAAVALTKAALMENKTQVLVLGNEGHGLRESICRCIRQNLFVPMVDGVESLNVAIAGSIIMAHFYQI